ncbi:MAG: molybdopterin-dependent oxidoreductase, partial [Myxococcota bacterium]
MAQTNHTFCRICESLCGLQVDVEDRRVVALRPDPDHVATQGYACVKGLNQHRMYDSPDRLKRVLHRVDGRLEPTSWSEALSAIGQRVQRLQAAHGKNTVAMYVGTAAGFGVLHPIFAQGFMDGIGSRSMYSSASQDCSNKFAVAQHMYGFAFTQPFPDLTHARCLIVVGANPAISKWSFGQVPNPAARLKALTARGGKLYFVDPRRTESAKVAGEHIPIRPGTDVFFYLSFLHEIFARRAYDRHLVDRYMKGLDVLEAVARPWSPHRTEAVTRIPVATLKGLVDEYLRAPGAALYCSTGVNMGGWGALAFWIQEAINAITGNLDRRGGTVVGQGVIDFAKF